MRLPAGAELLTHFNVGYITDHGHSLTRGGAGLGDYPEHGRAFPTRAATRAYSMTSMALSSASVPLVHKS
ncbi:hypothetical protein GCM10010510_07930 [Streptomyces anandii JCM 4720]|nr:hypothetical protein GCM10010510_07930 [Streptomyces anandii JCM 4720]